MLPTGGLTMMPTKTRGNQIWFWCSLSLWRCRSLKKRSSGGSDSLDWLALTKPCARSPVVREELELEEGIER